MIDSPDFDFSFSGLKTAVLYHFKKITKLSQKNQKTISDICASFQQACIDVIITKTITAAKKHKIKTILLGGGVAANRELQKQLKVAIANNLPKIKYAALPIEYCGDNAAMIATAGYFHARKKQFIPWKKINANPNWDLA